MAKLKETSSVYCISPEIGQGNPLSALAIARLLTGDTDSTHLINGLLVKGPKKFHKRMTGNLKSSEDYADKSERLRALTAIPVGLMTLGQWLINERLTQLNGEPLSNFGIFTQEHLLGVAPPEILEKWFPKGIFLYIPDVYPKQSAVKILKRLGRRVTPLVWNQSAYEELIQEGLGPILVAPVLPEGFLTEEDTKKIKKEKTETPQKIVIKTSGSGIAEKLDKWLEANVINQRQTGQRIEYWQPKGRVIYTDRSPSGQSIAIKDLSQYGQEFYRSLLEVDVIISYPSEMVQVVAWLRAQGWQGQFKVFPPRGAHEKRNLEWAIVTGIVDEIFEGDRFKSLAESQFAIEREALVDSLSVENELGTTSLQKVIDLAERIEKPRQLGISTKAIHLPEICLPPSPRELVITSVNDLSEEIDFSQIFGIHFRPKKEKDFWANLDEVFLYLESRKDGLPSNFYLSFHLEDFAYLEEGQLRQKLTELNQIAEKLGIKVLFENTTPRVDRELPRELYSLIDFHRQYGGLMADLPHLGYCLDIAHLGLAEPGVLEILGKVYQTIDEGWAYPTMMLNDRERELWLTFQEVLERTKVIHWSRAKGEKSIEERTLFKMFQKLGKEKREKLHNLYALLENLSSAHYSIPSDSDLFVVLNTILRKLNWRGRIVIESPDILEIVRERRRLFETVDYLHYLTQSKIITWLDYASRGEINDIDLSDLNSFLEQEFDRLSRRFFPIVEKLFPILMKYYNQERRKVNGGLYLRHILKTAMIGDINFNQLVDASLIKEEDYELFIVALLFHDAIEINAGKDKNEIERFKNELKTDFQYLFPERSESWRNELMTFIDYSTPKSQSMDYEIKKRDDFQSLLELWKQEKRIPLLGKACDMLANLEETINDLERGLEDGRMKKPLAQRIQVFIERYQEIKSLVGENSLVASLNAAIERILLNHLPALTDFVNQIRDIYLEHSQENSVELKYVVVGDKIIVAPASNFVHRRMVFDDVNQEEVYGGVIKVDFSGDFPVISFIQSAGSIPGDDKGSKLFKLLSGKKIQIDCLKTNPNYPIAGLTEE